MPGEPNDTDDAPIIEGGGRVIASRRVRMTPVTELTRHPRNPRQGDVGAIVQSIQHNGFYAPLIVQKSTGFVLAGNHRLAAAQELGMEKVPVVVVDVDDDAALRVLLADNRTADLATYDDSALAALLEELAVTPVALTGTGYDGDDLDRLLNDLNTSLTATLAPQSLIDQQPNYEAGDTRQLVIILPRDQYETVIRELERIADTVGTDSNTATFVWLVDEWTRANPSE